MDIRDIRKTASYMDDLKMLDAEVIGIEKMAEIVANSDSEYSFVLRVRDLNEEPVSLNPSTESPNYFLSVARIDDIYRSLFPRMTPTPPHFETTKNQEQKNVLTSNLSDTNTLLILGVLLEDKYQKRKSILAKIKEMGVKI